jgi:GTP cyclohydrolase I
MLTATRPDTALEDTEKQAEMASHVRALLDLYGEDVTREGLLDTPARVAKSMSFLTSGYRTTADDVVGDALFTAESHDLVSVQDIEFYSLCEHHMLPFFGKAHVAYIPEKHIIGLSKIPRVVDVFARRLQVQERFTKQLAVELQRILQCRGVAVAVQADHMCMMMRGVQRQHASTSTESFTGLFQTDAQLRAQWLQRVLK